MISKENKTVKDSIELELQDETKNIEAEQSLLKSYYGILMAILGAFLLSLSKTILKKSPLLMGSDHSFIRYSIHVLVLSFVIKSKGMSFLGPDDNKLRRLLVMRGFFGALGMLFLHFALTLIAPSDTVAIAHGSVLITSILARIFLKEKLTILHVFSLIATISGILLITQPSFIFKNKHFESVSSTKNASASFYIIENYSSTKLIFYTGIFLSICGAFTTSIVQTTIRKLCLGKVHYSVTIIYGSYFGIPLSLAISIILFTIGISYKKIDELNGLSIAIQLVYSIFSAFLGLSAQISLNTALKYEDASKIAVIKTVDLIFTFAFQYILMGISKDFISVIGAFLILFGTFIILIFKYFKKKDSTKPKNERSDLNCLRWILFIEF